MNDVFHIASGAPCSQIVGAVALGRPDGKP
jgi:hypothetical protein